MSLFLTELMELLMEFRLMMHGLLNKLKLLLLRRRKVVGGSHFLSYVLFHVLRLVLLVPVVLPDKSWLGWCCLGPKVLLVTIDELRLG